MVRVVSMLVAVGLWASVVPVGAHRSGWSARPSVGVTQDRAAPGYAVSQASVIGYVWRADDTPVPNIVLRLRNVVTGVVRATARSDRKGGFVFGQVEPGAYVVECIDDAGTVLAVGPSFTAAEGETVATFIRLSAGRPWFVSLFGTSGAVTQTAAVAIAAAASLGVTALAPTGRPASGGR